MKCSKCGNEFEGKFCSNCGAQSYYTYDTAKQNEPINQQPKYADPTVKIKKPKAEKNVYEKFAAEKVEKVKTEKLPRTPQQNMMIGCGTLLALPIILVVIAIMFSFINPAKADSPISDSPVADEYLISFSQATVKQHLKVPSSAQFPDRNSSAYKVRHNVTDRNYTVTGYVESQNALGVMLKSYYSVKMEYLYDTKQYHEIQTKIE